MAAMTMVSPVPSVLHSTVAAMTMVSPVPFVTAEPKHDPSKASTVDDAVHMLVANGMHFEDATFTGFHHAAEFFVQASGCEGEHAVHSESLASSPKPETVKMESKTKKRAVPWSNEEHQRFVVALKRFNGDDQSLAPGVADMIAITLGTRTPALVRSHAQKYFAKLRKTGDVWLAI